MHAAVFKRKIPFLTWRKVLTTQRMQQSNERSFQMKFLFKILLVPNLKS